MEANTRERNSVTSRNYRRTRGRRKLVHAEKVEVRSFEDGFHGSWHCGTVIGLEKHTRRVRYDHLLADDGKDNLMDAIIVSKAIEGIEVADMTNSDDYRGYIRPLPPNLELSKWNLPYGLCVDVYYLEAWWEGVIFDHEDDSEERKVFFPDLGDEINSGIKSMRITQDWDEFTEAWHKRGTWLFLELIAEYEKDHFIPVSVKQLWYDIRDKIGFEEIGEWTCRKRLLWEHLVLQVISDNLTITITHFLQDLDVPRPSKLEIKPSLEAFNEQSNHEDNGFPKSVPSMCLDLVPVETLSEVDKSQTHELATEKTEKFSCDNRAECESPQALSMLPSAVSDQKARTNKFGRNWEPVGSDIAPDAEFCPRAISEYLKKQSRQKAKDVRKHLKHLGWNMEHMTDESGNHRIRYISPDGRQSEHSLRQVCLSLMRKDMTLPSAMAQESSCLPYEQPTDKNRDAEDSWLGLPSDVIVDDDNEQSIEILKAYLKTEREDILRRDSASQTMIQKVKKHLYANGWAFSKRYSRHRQLQQYTSPTGCCVYSLKDACRKYLCSLNLENPFRKSRSSKNYDSMVKEKVKSVSFNSVQTIKKLERKRKSDSPSFRYNPIRRELSSDFRNGNLSMRHGKGKGLRTSMELSDDIRGGQGKACMLRSSKRVIDIETSSSKYQDPITVLSWLMDSNVVPPREKIYCSGKDSLSRKGGRISRNGIKCNCCGKLFSMEGFALHAGSKQRSPASNIFLKDGRSLLDCQVEANKEREKAEPCNVLEGKWCKGENDDVCSVCLYGGDLILCDGCPSSFHKSCIQLKDLPDGDWFCLSCCCGICGQVHNKADSLSSKEDHFISCNQCERKYHVCCLPNQDADNMSEKDENWFCSNDCEEICVSLQRLVRKSIVVGSGNLTWTLMKPLKSDSKLDPHEVEAWAESQSKLNLALDVMHECFDTVKEACVRDLFKDVIFSKSSNLKRLNMRGFYTILLERDDELISVATIRVFGKRVAEVPLIGTRFRHRRLGMCRILMDELGKRLAEIGVERLVLPAVPGVLSAWTNSFGFSKMTESERRSFLHFTFLDFQDTVMCQRILTKSPLADSVSLMGHLTEPHNEMHRNEEDSNPEQAMFLQSGKRTRQIRDRD